MEGPHWSNPLDVRYPRCREDKYDFRSLLFRPFGLLFCAFHNNTIFQSFVLPLSIISKSCASSGQRHVLRTTTSTSVTRTSRGWMWFSGV